MKHYSGQFNRQKLLDRFTRGGKFFLAALLSTVLIVSALGLALPAGALMHVPSSAMSVLGRIFCLALLALSLDLIWSYSGIFSLGHGAFFGLGGYVMGMHLIHQIDEMDVNGQSVLADFMAFQNWTALPWHWFGFDNLGLAIIASLALPAALAAIFGWLVFRSQLSGVYFAMVSLLLTSTLMFTFSRNEMGFGGAEGLTGFQSLAGFSLSFGGARWVLFVSSALALAMGYIGCRLIVTSRFGRLLVRIRDHEEKSGKLGYRPRLFKLAAFILAAMFAGLAGALYVPQAGTIGPGAFAPSVSIEVAICVALGGRGSLFGTAIGAIILSFAKLFFAGVWPAGWMYFLGSLCVIATLILPKGLVGTVPMIAALKFYLLAKIENLLGRNSP